MFTKEEKLNFFTREFSYILDDNLREFAKLIVENADDYFFTVPASSSGKYHPDFARGNGGLVRHSRAVAYFANEYARVSIEAKKLTRYEADCVVVAALVHDIKKQGDGLGEHTVREHPQLAAEYVRKIWEDYGADLVDEEHLEYICKAIRSHMGPWQEPCPQTRPELIVFYADYTASRREIVGIDFIDNNDTEAVEAYEAPVMTVEKYKFDFSKMKGLTMKEAYEKDPSFMRWMAIKEGFGNVEVQKLVREYINSL